MSIAEFQYINRFRKTDKDPKERITNYRIASTNPENRIYGGVYCVPELDYVGFLNKYYKDVLESKTPEYLTEAQLATNGPILIDLDFRFPYETTERQYTKEHLNVIIESYIDELSHIFNFDEQSAYKIYVLEKNSINRVSEKNITKDGIHLIIGISAEREMQILLRSRMIKKLQETCSDLPITNTWDSVLDKGISEGGTHWQMYGSTKPGCEPYKLTHIYTVGYDPSDGQSTYDSRSTDDPDWSPNWSILVHELSARCKNHPIFTYKPDFARELQKIEKNGKRPTRPPIENNNIQSTRGGVMESLRYTNEVMTVNTKDELNALLEKFIEDNHAQNRLHWNEIIWHTMALPKERYDPYSEWIRVGMALKHTSPDFFIVWMAFSAKSDSFDINDIDNHKQKWDSFEWRENGVSAKSIAYWCKADVPKKYREVKTRCAEAVLERALGGYEDVNIESKAIDRKGTTDVDLAEVLYSMFGDEYVCVDIKGNKWYQFVEPRWIQIDAGVGLRNEITEKLRALYTKKLMEYFALNETIPEDEDPRKIKKLQKFCEKLAKVCERLGSTGDINNIMTEARHKFHDPDFEKKLDENVYLICFKNGVLDFTAKRKEDLFRRGAPDDYLTKCTNIDYVPIDRRIHQPIINEIEDFMHKLFPDDPKHEFKEYVWNHLAATMTGLIAELQTFHIYIGGGQNGKSVLIKLMDLVLGEYKGTVPVNMLTDRRGKVGSATPEIMELKGTRMAVAQEPQKGERLNEGVIKEFSSGEDELQGRALYSGKMVKFLPQFNLVICTNYLPEIEGNDHGIWRRVRVINFKSRFTDNPVNNDADAPFQFLIDRTISKRMDTWKEVFASMLIDRAFKNKGRVPDCAEVISARDAYRQSQDCIAEFIAERVVVDTTGSITKTELNAEFKNWYENSYGRRGGPNAKDLHAEMDKKFKSNKKGKIWVGIRISYESDVQGVIDDDDVQEPNEL